MQTPANRTFRLKLIPRGLSRAMAAVLAAGVLAEGARAQVVTGSISTGDGPSAIAVNPVTNTVYVASSTRNLVTVINGTTLATSTVSVGAGPVAIDIDTSTNKIFVANHTDSSVTEIDGATKATSTIALNGTPNSIAVNSVTHEVYAPIDTYRGSYSYGAVELIDESTGAMTDLDKGIIGTGLAINPVTNMIYVANYFDVAVTVTVFNGADNSYSLVGDATGPIAIDTVSNKVFVANLEGGLVYIDGKTGFYSHVASGSRHYSVCVNPATHRAYSADSGGVDVFDEVTGDSVYLPMSALGAQELADAQTNRIFVSRFTAPGSLTMIDGASNATSSIAVGPLVFAMVENPATGMLFLLGNDAAGTLTVVDARAQAAQPVFEAQPVSVAAASGSSVAFNAVAGGGAGTSPTYQWFHDGAPLSDGPGITGSTSPTLFLGAATAASAGTYTCTISGSLGAGTSDPATLAVTGGVAPGHLINLSSRSFIGTSSGGPASNIIAGFVVAGPGPKDVVLRGVGPTLTTFGVGDAVPALSLSLFDSAAPGNRITSDAAWQTPPTAPQGPWAGKASPADATSADFTQIGAFPLAPASGDTAVKVTLPAGGYTSLLSVPAGASGEALAEVYDADASDTATHLSNLSARSFVNAVPIVAGFVIAGPQSQTILIRASGPALSPFGVSPVLQTIRLQLFDSTQHAVATNSGWQGSPSIVAAAASVGAFVWGDPASADAALLVTLPPGSYTAQVFSLDGGSGTALVEVYGLH